MIPAQSMRPAANAPSNLSRLIAEKAGILAGDRITAMNGLMGDQISAERLFDVLGEQPCGTVRSPEHWPSRRNERCAY